MTKTIAAGEFKAKCLHLLDEVKDSGTEIIVTKRGHPVARLVRLQTGAKAKKRLRVGWMKGTCEIVGDIVSPLFPDGYEPGASDPDWWYAASAKPGKKK